MNRVIKSVSWIATLAMAVSATPPALASQLVLVDQFTVPFTSPSRGLDFDAGTHTLWAVNNPPNVNGTFVWHLDLHGNLLSSWPATPQSHNLNGIAVDTAGQRVFYFQNAGRYVQEARMDGTWKDTTQLPWGYQNNTGPIQYDPLTGHIVMTYAGTSVGPQGFLHVSPESHAVLFTEESDLRGVTGSSIVQGFCLSRSDYWLLGNSGGIPTLIRVDRSSFQVQETFDIPGGNAPWTISGLTRDPDTQLVYILDRSDASTTWVRVFQVPEPSAWSLLALGVLALIRNRSSASTQVLLTVEAR